MKSKEIVVTKSQDFHEEISNLMDKVNRKIMTSIKRFCEKDKLYLINYSTKQDSNPEENFLKRNLNSTSFIKNNQCFLMNEWTDLNDVGVYENLEVLESFEKGFAHEIEVQLTVEDVIEQFDGLSDKKKVELYKRITSDFSHLELDEAIVNVMNYKHVEFKQNRHFIIGLDSNLIYDIYIRIK